jgi:hypothetical protein
MLKIQRKAHLITPSLQLEYCKHQTLIPDPYTNLPYTEHAAVCHLEIPIQ